MVHFNLALTYHFCYSEIFCLNSHGQILNTVAMSGVSFWQRRMKDVVVGESEREDEG